MGKLETIEHEVQSLSPQELADFRAWFAQFDADLWDYQIEQDVNNGKLDSLAEEALKAFQSGQCTKL